MNICVLSDRSVPAKLKLNSQELGAEWQSVLTENTEKYSNSPIQKVLQSAVEYSGKELPSLLRS